jgi:hypothetical protein
MSKVERARHRKIDTKQKKSRKLIEKDNETTTKKRHLNTQQAKSTQRQKEKPTAQNERTSAEERNKLTISHQLGNLLVLRARDFDIVDCHHDSEELCF